MKSTIKPPNQCINIQSERIVYFIQNFARLKTKTVIKNFQLQYLLIKTENSEIVMKFNLFH